MILQECKICGKRNFADLRAHLKAHKITWKEYQEQYGERALCQNNVIKIPQSESIYHSYHRESVARMRSGK